MRAVSGGEKRAGIAGHFGSLYAHKACEVRCGSGIDVWRQKTAPDDGRIDRPSSQHHCAPNVGQVSALPSTAGHRCVRFMRINAAGQWMLPGCTHVQRRGSGPCVCPRPAEHTSLWRIPSAPATKSITPTAADFMRTNFRLAGHSPRPAKGSTPRHRRDEPPRRWSTRRSTIEHCIDRSTSVSPSPTRRPN